MTGSTKIYLSIAILLTSFLAGNAYGEDEVYYCAETDGNGFYFDKKLKKYARSGFNTNKFKIKFDRTDKTIKIKGHPRNSMNLTYTCTAPYARIGEPELLNCTNNLYHLGFNFNNGRFVSAFIAGYVGGDGDTINLSYGKCDKF